MGFLQAQTTPALLQRLEREHMTTIAFALIAGSEADADATISHAKDLNATWVVVDGYVFGTEWQRRVKNSGLLLLALDDFGHAGHYLADIVLNQNASALASIYPHHGSKVCFLLGTKYVLLRNEFVQRAIQSPGLRPVGRRILVTMGGSDPDNVTGRIIQAVAKLKDIEVAVVIGGSNPHLASLQRIIAETDLDVRLLVDVEDISTQMAWADLAISAAGSTVWELAFLRVPTLYVILAGNQEQNARQLATWGAGLNLGWHHRLSETEVSNAVSRLLADTTARLTMANSGRTLVDGQGAERVVMEMKKKMLCLRSPSQADAHGIWLNANDPTVRAASFSSEPISWEEHSRWFAKQLDDPRYRLLLASNVEGEEVGQIRFEISNTEATVSLSLVASMRQQGWGSALIDRACEEIFATSAVRIVHAFIKVENVASSRAFEKASFTLHGDTILRGHPSLHYMRTNPRSARTVP